jgi:hypothetical protein
VRSPPLLLKKKKAEKKKRDGSLFTLLNDRFWTTGKKEHKEKN